MKIIEVPIFNDDGSVQVTHVLTPEQVQPLLQFALNFLTATGLQAVNGNYGQMELQLEDIDDEHGDYLEDGEYEQ